MAPDQRFVVAQRIGEGGYHPGVLRVAQGYGGVPQQAAPLRPLDGTALEPGPERLRCQPQHFDEVRHFVPGTGSEGRMAGFGRAAVPGTDILAVVAPEHAVSHCRAVLQGNSALQFDGMVGDAAARIDHVGFDDGVRGTGFETQGARAAVIGCGPVRSQFDVEEDLPDQQPRSHALVDEVGVLPEPPQAGADGEFPFQHGPSVHVYLPFHGTAGPVLHESKQRQQLLFHHVVVIVAPGIPGDFPARSAFGRRFV